MTSEGMQYVTHRVGNDGAFFQLKQNKLTMLLYDFITKSIEYINAAYKNKLYLKLHI